MNFKEKTKKLVTNKAFELLKKYVNLIEEKNKVMNLTGFTGDRLWEEGIYESIFVLQEIFGKQENKKILDIGAGVGFPSVPYLIVNSKNHLTIYEPLLKRILFLEKVKKELNLNINILNIRAEDSKQEECFDIIMARAVAKFSILAEISHKPAKIGAKFCFMKGPKVFEEIKKSNLIIKKLNLKPEIKKIYTKNRDNFVIYYSKENKTLDGFPRKWKDIIS